MRKMQRSRAANTTPEHTAASKAVGFGYEIKK
jgi:hypothetical protein